MDQTPAPDYTSAKVPLTISHKRDSVGSVLPCGLSHSLWCADLCHP